MYYYVGLESRTHAFLLEHRMKSEGMKTCEITYMPREIMIDLCNIGVRFKENELPKAIELLRRFNLQGLKLYKEVVRPDRYYYHEISY
ncbi:MAG TPA: DUF3343 domain-containing protein [Hungateiclostridium thermocellum]|jgi:hypothetical protein|uniref:Uncharacterized protein DUF3343 n=2 Tax=Acetivibrio thermocellus TaxID=1515 RepID=A0AB36TER6_ACETH|nr:DUF3343 domain-containing protein [Acetivibrio thermocellus]CDG35783.1 hypothetical protein CTHBC1_1133 [Acetivibrio thermocellus BC1]ABN52319.1 hypothetical protein Cthe_1087 [Acetivibrio thermocellus ATCC 27405]ADU74190.1 hypothetical protein Clo1313_1126 [Acetivibrio thermocellus DSM 1313]ALX08133.1 Protein of unknown function DUF3343 [Acetivibrio thermocellus AD2]ANV75880.1 Protein of unknown function DUF3343 [Acetivibrio thermocellus DSM 2360]